MLHDRYGTYTPSVANVGIPRCGPIPPLPCQNCSPENGPCEDHKYVLFVKTLKGETFTIPYGHWENWDWYKERCAEVTGLHVGDIRLIYAGCERSGTQRHSGLQYESTLHLVIKTEEKKVQSEKSESPSPIDNESEDSSEKS